MLVLSLFRCVILGSGLANAFVPYVQPSAEGGEDWHPVIGPTKKEGTAGSGAEKVHSMALKRWQAPVDENEHPEVRHVQSANRATRRYRRRGIPGPEVDSAEAIRAVRRSLQRRGLEERQNVNDAADIAIIPGGATKASASILPAETPKTKDSMGVSQDGSDFSYFSFIQFGSKKKQFQLVIDTGSADTWIPAADCKSKVCFEQARFGPGDSESLSISKKKFDIVYGSGDVAGVVATDSVHFAGFSVTASFGLATQISDEFVNFDIDGIFGLGFSKASQQRVPTLLDVLRDGDHIKRRLYGIGLSRASDSLNNGVINFGGVDNAMFEGELSFSPSVSTKGLWEIAISGTQIGGKEVDVRGRSAVIDTGTSLMLLPPMDALRLHSKIPGSTTNGETFGVPCNTELSIDISFSNVTFSIPPKDYIGARISRLEDICLSLIGGRQVLDSTTWLLGDVFLKNVYSVFDVDNNRIGFGKRAKVGSDTAGNNDLIARPSATVTVGSESGDSSMTKISSITRGLSDVTAIGTESAGIKATVVPTSRPGSSDEGTGGDNDSSGGASIRPDGRPMVSAALMGVLILTLTAWL